MPKTLTIEMLKQHTEITVPLEALSMATGEEVTVRCRWIGREEYLGLLPLAAPGSDRWGVVDPKKLEGLSEEAQAAERERARDEGFRKAIEWVASLKPALREAREDQARDVLYRVVSITALEPRLTLEQARQLGPDAEAAAVAVLRASGLLKKAEPAEPAGTAKEAAQAPVDAEEPAALASAA